MDRTADSTSPGHHTTRGARDILQTDGTGSTIVREHLGHNHKRVPVEVHHKVGGAHARQQGLAGLAAAAEAALAAELLPRSVDQRVEVPEQ